MSLQILSYLKLQKQNNIFFMNAVPLRGHGALKSLKTKRCSQSKINRFYVCLFVFLFLFCVHIKRGIRKFICRCKILSSPTFVRRNVASKSSTQTPYRNFSVELHLSKALFSLDPDNLQLYCFLGLGAL